MTRYRVPVADPLLEQADFWLPVEGFRLVSVDGPWPAHPYVTICTFEDDNAPPELEGKLVEPAFTTHYEANEAGYPTGNVSHVTITDRHVIGGSRDPAR